MNGVIFQYFEWYTLADGTHWRKLEADAQHLRDVGISHVWMPPAFKATGTHDVGYGVYDLFDLGEFDQKGAVRTKYGTKEEYLAAIRALNAVGISPLADVVLNHKAGADEKEAVQVVEVAPDNRQQVISEPHEIDAWTRFTFPGRQGAHNDFQWHWYHFSGVDYDARHDKTGIYMILGDNKGWAYNNRVDSENGNYDYLMYTNVDYRHPEVVEHVKDWAKWFVTETGIKGFRLDAIKHIESDFMKDFIQLVLEHTDDSFYVFGEYWKDDYAAMEEYLKQVEFTFDLVDVMLHMNFFEAGQQGEHYDLRKILDNTLMQKNPTKAVTFVDNHDSQPTQALESFVPDWFKLPAYGIILLRGEGLPTIFYGDYYGISGEHPIAGRQEQLDKLLHLRQQVAYGKQVDYFDNPHCIGWTRLGDEQHPSACAVLVANKYHQQKTMFVGEAHAGACFVDALGTTPGEVVINEKGEGDFPLGEAHLAVWVKKEA